MSEATGLVIRDLVQVQDAEGWLQGAPEILDLLCDADEHTVASQYTEHRGREGWRQAAAGRERGGEL